MSEHNSDPRSQNLGGSPNQNQNNSNIQRSQTSSQLSGLETYVTPSQASCQNYQHQAFSFGQNLPNKRACLSVASNGGRKRANKSDNQGYQYPADSYNNYHLSRPNRASSKSINFRPSSKFTQQGQNLTQKDETKKNLQINQNSKTLLRKSVQQVLNTNSIIANSVFQDIREAKMQFQSGQDDFSDENELQCKKQTKQGTLQNNSKVYYQDQMLSFNSHQQRKDCCCQLLGNQNSK